MKAFCYFVLVLFSAPVVAEDTVAGKSELMLIGSQLSLIADELEQSAKDTIKLANSERKTIIGLRQRLNKDAANNELSRQLENTNQRFKALQQAAPLIRAQSEQVRLLALAKLQQGLLSHYSTWINNHGPITLSAKPARTEGGTMAHNTRIVSVKPAMKSMQATPSTQREQDMSLELSSSLSQEFPEQIDTSSFSLSRERQYFAHIEVEGEGSVQLNQIQSWLLVLSELDGQPLNDAEVNFTGHMPGHVHGLPTQPLLTEQLAPGVYRLSGVKFQMSGWWVIELEIDVPLDQSNDNTKDTVRFNLSL